MTAQRDIEAAQSYTAGRGNGAGQSRFGHLLETLDQDLRFALRTLRKSPGYALAAVVTLALGIGANTAIFSLVHGVLLRPLPYLDGGRLVVLQQSAPRAGIDNLPFSIRETYDFRERNRTFSHLVEYHTMTFTLLGRGEPERVSAGVVSAELFDTLGVQPLHGRTFRPADDDLGAEAVLVLSYPYWRRSFGGDPKVVGQVFEMNNRPHTVVGVLPPIPQFPNDNDVYMPTSACPFRANAEANAMPTNRSAFRALTVFGRLAPGRTLDGARADLASIGEGFRQDHPETYTDEMGYQVTARPLKEVLTLRARPTLLMLLGTAGLVLLIACANVANLAVARTLRREREMAVRATLGAGRGRLLRQMLVESTVLSLAGGALGLTVAYAGLDLLVSFISRFTPRAIGIGIDPWVLLFTLIVALATGIAFGALPVVTSKLDLAAALHQGGRTTSGHDKLRLRNGLIIAQVALAVMSLVGAGLMLRSFSKLRQVDPGFRPESVLTARLSLNWSKYQDAAAARDFWTRLLERVRSHPGVVTVAAATDLPYERPQPRNAGFDIENRPLDDGGVRPRVDWRIVSPEYFRAIGIPLLRGRSFGDQDHAEAPQVAVINRSMARHYWGDRDPIGRRISLDQGQTWSRIVGVVGDVLEYGLDQPATDEAYFPLSQGGWSQWLLVRTAAGSDPLAMSDDIKEIVYGLDPDQPLAEIETMVAKQGEWMSSPRTTTWLLGLFAGLALVITATGIGSVIAFTVSQRTREIGVRMALGARRGKVLWMVLSQGLALVAVGLVAGLGAAVYLGRTMSWLLFETRPDDPFTLAMVAFVLLAAAALACWLPARRATAIDPTVALRSD